MRARHCLNTSGVYIMIYMAWVMVQLNGNAVRVWAPAAYIWPLWPQINLMRQLRERHIIVNCGGISTIFMGGTFITLNMVWAGQSHNTNCGRYVVTGTENRAVSSPSRQHWAMLRQLGYTEVFRNMGHEKLSEVEIGLIRSSFLIL